MSSPPRILASFLHGTLEVIDGMDARLGEQVRASLKPGMLEEIQDAWGASWLPVGHDVAVTEAFFRIAGEERACQAMRDNLVATFEKPILRPIKDAALRVFGATTEKLLGWAPRVWGLIFRDVGRMGVEAASGSAWVRFERLPPEVAGSRPYLVGIGAALTGVFALTGVRGTARLISHDDAEACFELRWEQP